MSDNALEIHNLGKRYRIGVQEQKSETFFGALWTMISAPVRNFRKLKSLSVFKKQDEVNIIWAIKDINFNVAKGELVGIIGKNGAGKSTLLKVLSKITEPTVGRATINGKVSSLLEVGTGFHPDLTGRDNVYLNGTILGMTKAEIDSKFNDIVEFSGIRKFIETPVKRYSSGMKVRLAFAVSAFLDPDILIIDEVLAVGDLEFQRKCISKMNEVASAGRTVLFVSHNMAAIRTLCTRGIVLSLGKIMYDGDISEAIKLYEEDLLALSTIDANLFPIKNSEHDIQLNYLSNKTINNKNGADVEIYFELETNVELTRVGIGIRIFASDGTPYFKGGPDLTALNIDSLTGKQSFKLTILNINHYVVSGEYIFSFVVGVHKTQAIFLDKVGRFTVPSFDIYGTGNTFEAKNGIIPFRFALSEVQ